MDYEDEIKKLQAERKDRVPLSVKQAVFDEDIYATGRDFTDVIDDVEDEADEFKPNVRGSHPSTLAGANAMSRIVDKFRSEVDPGEEEAVEATWNELRAQTGRVDTKIANRETDYQARRTARKLSPERGGDVFAGEEPSRSYKDIMLAQQLDREKDALLRKAARVEREKAEEEAAAAAAPSVPGGESAPAPSCACPLTSLCFNSFLFCVRARSCSWDRARMTVV